MVSTMIEFVSVSVTAVLFWLMGNEVLDVIRGVAKVIVQIGGYHNGINTSVDWVDLDAP